MTENSIPMHYVCTWDEAVQLINGQAHFWVCNCGCREGKGGCERSRMDVCLTFSHDGTVTGSERKTISCSDALAIVDEARSKQLVCRPFRDEKTRTTLEGICFCCDDCCAYFLNPDEVCDKGKYVEKTDLRRCTHCGDCEPVCYFKARLMKADSLLVQRERCHGCGLCVEVCPTDCIEMTERT
ncbi:MAG: 4Fe-4S binding protein [Candidatus Zixiibacteriota bacterium]|nr:MAG: 4Fe-4S binding protein [candidate division Zixibacteria bacterium]